MRAGAFARAYGDIGPAIQRHQQALNLPDRY